MKLDIRGANIEITGAIEDYLLNKLSKLNKYFTNASDILAKIVIRVRGHVQIVEVTINTGSFVLRCEQENKDLYAAIDLIVDKLERQVRKNKTRILAKQIKESTALFEFPADEVEEDEKQEIIKRKKVDMKPMSEEEALLQIELLGHDFFIFQNVDTDSTCILYRRKDGFFGLIDTK